MDRFIPPGLARLATLERLLDDRLPSDDVLRADLLRALELGTRRRVRELIEKRLGARYVERLDELPETWWLQPDELQILFTGFKPWGEHDYNPSADVARGANDQIISVREEFPVEWNAARWVGSRLIRDDNQVVVHFGLAARREHVSLERFAHNVRCARDDDHDSLKLAPHGIPLDDVAPSTLETLLPLEALARRLNDELGDDHPTAKVTRDAGDFICNATYYHTLAAIRRQRHADGSGAALFVHVPPMERDHALDYGRRFAAVLRAFLDDF